MSKIFLFLFLSVLSLHASLGKIEKVFGAAEIIRGKISLSVKEGEAIHPGDMIKTKKQALVKARMDNRVLIVIGSNSEYRFEPSVEEKPAFAEGGAVFGYMATKIIDLNPEKFRLKAVTYAAGIRKVQIGGGTLAQNNSSLLVYTEGKDLYDAKLNALLFALSRANASGVMGNKDDVISEKALNTMVEVLEQKTVEKGIEIKARVRVRDQKTAEDVGEMTDDEEKTLKITAWTEKTLFHNKEPFSFRIQVNKDSYVVIDYKSADGQMMQIFPNDLHLNNFVKRDRVLSVPSKEMNFEFEISPPFGREQVIVRAASYDNKTETLNTRGITIRKKRKFEEEAQAIIEITTEP